MPIENFARFNLELGRFERETLPEAAKTIQQKLAIEFLRRVVLKTPVDTGRARGNWQTTTGTPSEGVTEILDPTGTIAIQQGSQVIAQINPFGVIWIANNLPYIEALENGHSKQAPNGMVRLTLAELQAFEGAA